MKCFVNQGIISNDTMQKIAAIILENDKGEFLLALRDNKSWIPFPNHWDLIGGHVEEGETPEEAVKREYKEELGLELKEFEFYKEFECLNGDAFENIKFIYTGKINIPVEEITLLEGQYVRYFTKEEIPDVKFANIIKSIVMKYISEKYK
jgi:8-oxo-dGTP diphosphatase